MHGFCLTLVVAFAVAVPDGRASPSVGAVPVATPATPQPQKLRCRLIPVTGSLAQTRRICLTDKGWRAQSDAARNMLDRRPACANRTTCGGN
jgi:hypothetical protein